MVSLSVYTMSYVFPHDTKVSRLCTHGDPEVYQYGCDFGVQKVMVAALECGLHLELHCVNGWPSIRFGKKVIPYNYLLFSQQPLGISVRNFTLLRDYPNDDFHTLKNVCTITQHNRVTKTTQ